MTPLALGGIITLRRRLLRWYRGNDRTLPWRQAWERSGDPYFVWVSEVMLQQTTIAAVLPRYPAFIEAFPAVTALAAASEADLRPRVAGLGYYRRFENLRRAAAVVAGRRAWPQNAAGWQELPGIGPYTAAAIASITAGEPVAAVDGNGERVMSRLGDLRVPLAESKAATRELAGAYLDPAAPGDFNQAVMELGQLVCRARQPRCGECPVAGSCLAFRRGSVALAPAPAVRRAPTPVAMELWIPRREGRVGLVERPASARFLRGRWGFLTITQEGGEGAGGGWRWDGGDPEDGSVKDSIGGGRSGGCNGSAAVRVRGEAPSPVKGSFKHSITHHALTVGVRSVAPDRLPAGAQARTRWVEPAAVPGELVASLDRKAWALVAAEG